jgi:hypothetical protein
MPAVCRAWTPAAGYHAVWHARHPSLRRLAPDQSSLCISTTVRAAVIADVTPLGSHSRCASRGSSNEVAPSTQSQTQCSMCDMLSRTALADAANVVMCVACTTLPGVCGPRLVNVTSASSAGTRLPLKELQRAENPRSASKRRAMKCYQSAHIQAVVGPSTPLLQLVAWQGAVMTVSLNKPI